MSVSTDLAKVCARESAIDRAVSEMAEIAAQLPGRESKILTVSVLAQEGRPLLNWQASFDLQTFSSPSLEALLLVVQERPNSANDAKSKRAEAAKLLAEAAQLDGGGK